MVKAIVLGGSRGIGKAISDSLKSIDIDVFATSRKDIDTSNLDSVKEFLEKNNFTHIFLRDYQYENYKSYFAARRRSRTSYKS